MDKEEIRIKIDELSPWQQKINIIDGIETIGIWDAAKYFELVEPYIQGELEGKKVADCGCNGGGVALEFARHGAEVIGIEPIDHHFAQCEFVKEVSGLRNLSFRQDSVFNLHNMGHFDIILAFGLVYHFRYFQLLLDYLAQLEFDQLFISTQTTQGPGLIMTSREIYNPVVKFPYWGYEPTYEMFCSQLKNSGFTDIMPMRIGKWGNGFANCCYVACRKGTAPEMDVEALAAVGKSGNFFV